MTIDPGPEVPTVRVFRCRLPAGGAPETLARALARLPSRLHADIHRYHRAEDRLARLAARLLVRKGLEDAGLDPFPTLERWQKDSWGRPVLAGCGIDISISHSGSWAGAALAAGARVGLDIEAYRPICLEALRPFLAPPELAAVEKAPDPQRAAIRRWSLREALLKADGRGLLAPEEVIRALPTNGRSPGGNWHLDEQELDQACLFLATDAGNARICHREWAWAELL